MPCGEILQNSQAGLVDEEGAATELAVALAMRIHIRRRKVTRAGAMDEEHLKDGKDGALSQNLRCTAHCVACANSDAEFNI